MATNGMNGRARQSAMQPLGVPFPQTCISDVSHLPFVAAGECLVEGDVYLDLANPVRGPFKAMRWQCAGSKNRYVAASKLSASTWDLLVRMTSYIGLSTAVLGESTAPSTNA